MENPDNGSVVFFPAPALPSPVFLSMDVIDVCSGLNSCSGSEEFPGQSAVPADSTALLTNDGKTFGPIAASGRLAIPELHYDDIFVLYLFSRSQRLQAHCYLFRLLPACLLRARGCWRARYALSDAHRAQST